MAETVMVGIDGSEGARRAAELAADYAKLKGIPLVVAYVIERSPYTFNTPEENQLRHQRREAEIERARTQVVEPLVDSLQKKTGMEVKGVVRHGHAAEVLTDLAGEVNATHIFVGRRGLSKFKALMFGSVSGFPEPPHGLSRIHSNAAPGIPYLDRTPCRAFS